MCLERGKGRDRVRERETWVWERNIDWLPPVHSLIRDQSRNLHKFPDWKSNPQPQPFGTQDDVSVN